VETQQSGHTPRYGPEIKNGSSAKDGVMRDNPKDEIFRRLNEVVQPPHLYEVVCQNGKANSQRGPVAPQSSGAGKFACCVLGQVIF